MRRHRRSSINIALIIVDSFVSAPHAIRSVLSLEDGLTPGWRVALNVRYSLRFWPQFVLRLSCLGTYAMNRCTYVAPGEVYIPLFPRFLGTHPRFCVKKDSKVVR